jgi:glycosyltransferase involved in cell wall biosynthesis
MNCRNGEKYLREAIDSVYAQTYTPWEIIFWDNLSTDNSAEIARRYDHRLRYFRGTAALPLGAARNLALEQARGEYLAFLDCDDLWRPDKLEKQVPLFQDPDVGLVFSDALCFNDAGEKQLFYSRKKYYSGNCFSQLLTGNYLIISTVLIKRIAIATQQTWFDPDFNMVEEYDLFIRIAHKWKFSMINEPLAKWRIHSSSWTWNKSQFSDKEKSHMLSKYHILFPNFAVTFAKEIDTFKANMAIAKARILILQRANGCREARKCVFRYIFRNKKACLLFFISFLPEKIGFFILSKMSKAILPA